MSNENEYLNQFDYNLICEYFSNVERQGPGSPEITLKALSFIDNLTCWTEHYFAPQVKARKIFMDKYAGNKAAEEFIAAELHEQDLFNKYKAFYGYVFYIGKKI